MHGFDGKNDYHSVSIYKNCMINVFSLNFFFQEKPLKRVFLVCLNELDSFSD